MNSVFVKSLRWVLALPAAVAAYFVGYRLFLWCNYELFEIEFLTKLFQVIACGFSAACFVVVGCYTAPQHRKIVSVVLTTIGVMISIVCVVLLAFYDDEPQWWLIFQCVANIIGCICGTLFIFEETIE
ncbi:MAG: hypothetical protein K6A96_10890 [Prevotella sp.]|nr:hypothetical protein [Prevotella sp.]